MQQPVFARASTAACDRSAIITCIGLLLWLTIAPVQAHTPTYNFKVVARFPHDPGAYTEGLVWSNGGLYESVGLHGKSELRRVNLKTGKVEARHRLDERYFGEGLAKVGDRLIQITWTSGTGFVYAADDLHRESTFSYPGLGWGLVSDGRRLIMSDGSATLRFLNPRTLTETGHLTVRLNGKKIPGINELEMVKGELWANVWPTDRIARIDPDTGRVVGVIIAAGLRRSLAPGVKADVLNGIAYDAADDRLFVTGKYWPRLFEVKAVPRY